MSRRQPGAVISDPDAVAQRVASMTGRGEVVPIDGSVITATVESICLHGDSPGAVQIAAAVRQRLVIDAIHLKPFT